MKWIKLGNNIPLIKMLWLDINGCWFTGKFVVDSEYGECISVDDGYVSLGAITHYMIIDLPK